MGKIVDRQELAEIFDAGLSTIKGWEDAGMPRHAIKSGARNILYDTAACIKWRVSREIDSGKVSDNGKVLDFQLERARLTKWQADEREIKTKILRSEVIPADLVLRETANILRSFRSRALSLPSKIRARSSAIDDSDFEDIERLVHEMLTELSNDILAIRDRCAAQVANGVVESAVTSTEADAESVG